MPFLINYDETMIEIGVVGVWAILGVLGWLNTMNRWPIGCRPVDIAAIPLCMIIGPVALVASIAYKQE